VRFVLSYVAASDLYIEQLEIVGAFLESKIEKLLYLRFPEEFTTARSQIVLTQLETATKATLIVARLLKSIYGTKQAALNWFHKFDQELTQMGF
jgi:hypothetical protein